MSKEKNKSNLITPGFVVPFALVTSLYFLWALPSTMNDVLIKQFMKSLEVSLTQVGFVLFAYKIGYFCLALPAGMFMQKKGYKAGILLGLTIFALGCFLFYPAAMSQQYLFFLCAIFVIGGGLSFTEIGASGYVLNLGDPASSERRMNLAQSFNPIGSIFGVTAGTLFIFSGNEPTPVEITAMKETGAYEPFLKEEALRVFPPYLVIGLLVLAVAFFIRKAKFPKIEVEADSKKGEKGSLRALLKCKHWYGAVFSQFFYLGAQLGTWGYLITFIQQNSDLKEKAAGGFLIANMFIFMFGRFFATWLMKYVKPVRLMGIYALINIVLVGISVLCSGWANTRFGIEWNTRLLPVPFTDFSVPFGVYTLIATSFFMSLMYPTNFASGVKNLGQNTKLGSSILIMSMIGGALLSLLMGRIADTGWANGQIAAAMIVPVISYGVICWYAFRGAKDRG
ncbi:L-fucose:H+ symporter permease [Bacteroidia bacterium]|nr:L-fucose:H+ symporter permease [Bacteroidia bacterium]